MIVAREVTKGARPATALPTLAERLAADPGLVRYAMRLVLQHGRHVPQPDPRFGQRLLHGHIGRKRFLLQI